MDFSGPLRFFFAEFLPTTPTDKLTVDCWIDQMYIMNDGVGPATVSVYDRQSTPIPIVPAIPLPKGGLISLSSEDGCPMPNGITWSASAAGVAVRISGTMSIP